MLCNTRPSRRDRRVSSIVLDTQPSLPLRYRYTLCSIAHIDEKNRAIKHLEDELHVRGVAGADERVEEIIELGQGDGARIRGERTRAGARVDGYTTQESLTALGMVVKTRRGSGKDEKAEWCTRRHVLPQNLSSGKRMVASLSGLRSELQSLTTQVLFLPREFAPTRYV